MDDNLLAQPPETIIWVAASALRDQAATDTRDKSRVERAIELIAGVLKKIGVWAARTVAAGVSAATVTIVIKGADAWAVNNQEKLVELIDAAVKWLPFLN